MHCPACKKPLIAVEYSAVEIDYCAACHGVWLDAGELELLFGNADSCRRFLGGGEAEAHGEKPRKCPICAKRMAKYHTRGDDVVLYDQCTRDHGLWLDQGELQRMLEGGAALPGGEHVTEFLREMFPAGPRAHE
jgi:uncharacterized protein